MGVANQQHPASVANYSVLGAIRRRKHDHAAIESLCAGWLADAEDVRTTSECSDYLAEMGRVPRLE